MVVRTLDSGMGRKSTVMIDTKTGRERVFDSFRCPLISMVVEGESEKVFIKIDSGTPLVRIEEGIPRCLEGAKNYVQGPRKQQQTWGGGARSICNDSGRSPANRQSND